MNTPTSGGWRDVLVLFKIVGSTGHICEMQIALHMLLIARQEMGAHAAYAQARHFIEIFEASSGQQFQPSEFFSPKQLGARDAGGDVSTCVGGVSTVPAATAAAQYENAVLLAKNDELASDVKQLTIQLHAASAAALVGWIGFASVLAYVTLTGRGRTV